MAWNPGIYNQYKSERAAAFHDLLNLVRPVEAMQVIDLGCGTGELTKTITEKLTGATVKGIDSSAEMLAEAPAGDHLTFEVKTVEEQLKSDEKFDLVFSNAAIQWVYDHETIFPQMIASLNKGGQLAIQMPAQHHNMTNILLGELADEPAFKEQLKDFKRISPVLDIERYANILFENGAVSMTVFEKIYPLVLPDTGALFNWVSGTALIPYMERLDAYSQQLFMGSYREKLNAHFTGSPVFYPFKRMLIHAIF